MSEKINREFNERKETIAMMINVFKSTLSENFIKENIINLQESSGVFNVESYPDLLVASANIEDIDDLKQWFACMDARINGLMNVSKQC